jgi:ribonuclease HI
MTLLFTDGACINNGKASAKASFAVYIDNKIIRGYVEPYEYELSSTNELVCTNKNIIPSNNRGELLGIIYGFKYIYNLEQLNPSLPKKEYILYSDSQICIKTINEWYKNREKKGTLHEFKNLDLITIMMILYKKINIICIHTKAHTQLKLCKTDTEKLIWNGNNIVDKYASEILNKNENINKYQIIYL